MKKIWVVVADDAIARILQWPETGGELESVEELTDPAAHANESEFRHDSAGRRGWSTTSSASDSGKHIQAETFAARVAQRLDEAFQQGLFNELRLSAAPRFLGMLRKALSPSVAGTLSCEMDKDYIHMDNHGLTEKLMARRQWASGMAR